MQNQKQLIFNSLQLSSAALSHQTSSRVPGQGALMPLFRIGLPLLQAQERQHTSFSAFLRQLSEWLVRTYLSERRAVEPPLKGISIEGIPKTTFKNAKLQLATAYKFQRDIFRELDVEESMLDRMIWVENP